MPKWLCYFMQRDGEVLNMVLHIFLWVNMLSLQSNCPGAAQVDRAALHIGAVDFIHRFGSSLSGHVHFAPCPRETYSLAVDEGKSVNSRLQRGQNAR